jgi:Holliday junction resolvase RusA-like endonuclease
VDLSPVQVSVNARFLNNGTIPPNVRRAMNDIKDAVEQQILREGFSVGTDDFMIFSLDFYFPTWAGDIDNPIKRTIDAIMDAFNRDKTKAKINDNRVIELHVRKMVADHRTAPRIEGCIKLVDGDKVKSPAGVAKPVSEPTWVG